MTITVTVPGSGGLGFIGFKDTVDSSITSILISSVDSLDSSFNNDFAMGPVTFGTPTVPPGIPEPSTFAIATVSTLGLMLPTGGEPGSPGVRASPPRSRWAGCDDAQSNPERSQPTGQAGGLA